MKAILLLICVVVVLYDCGLSSLVRPCVPGGYLVFKHQTCCVGIRYTFKFWAKKIMVCKIPDVTKWSKWGACISTKCLQTRKRHCSKYCSGVETEQSRRCASVFGWSRWYYGTRRHGACSKPLTSNKQIFNPNLPSNGFWSKCSKPGTFRVRRKFVISVVAHEEKQKCPNYCRPNPCKNRGRCTSSDTFYCKCQPGFRGRQCTTNINECLSSPCQNGGSCTDEINDFYCTCKPGYSGKRCEIDINECKSSPCKNSGSCTDLVNNYRCTCIPGFTGRNCEIDINECESSPCLNSGVCTDQVNSYQCSCADGYTGDRCETDIDDCLANGCLNGATCIDQVNNYACQCLPGYTGNYCQTDIDECEPVPCQNGGDCTDLINGFMCTCVAGYTGESCQTDIDECASGPCKNGASCEHAINSYTCSCAPGFTGENCITNINECASSPCRPQRMCVDLINSYRCDCLQGNDPDCGQVISNFGKWKDCPRAYKQFRQRTCSPSSACRGVQLEQRRWKDVWDTNCGECDTSTNRYFMEFTCVDVCPSRGFTPNFPNGVFKYLQTCNYEPFLKHCGKYIYKPSSRSAGRRQSTYPDEFLRPCH